MHTQLNINITNNQFKILLNTTFIRAEHQYVNEKKSFFYLKKIGMVLLLCFIHF